MHTVYSVYIFETLTGQLLLVVKCISQDLNIKCSNYATFVISNDCYIPPFSEIFQGLDIESEMEKINRPRHQHARKQMGWDNETEELS